MKTPKMITTTHSILMPPQNKPIIPSVMKIIPVIIQERKDGLFLEIFFNIL